MELLPTIVQSAETRTWTPFWAPEPQHLWGLICHAAGGPVKLVANARARCVVVELFARVPGAACLCGYLSFCRPRRSRALHERAARQPRLAEGVPRDQRRRGRQPECSPLAGPARGTPSRSRAPDALRRAHPR